MERGEVYKQEWQAKFNRRRDIPLTRHEPTNLVHGTLHRLGSGSCNFFFASGRTYPLKKYHPVVLLIHT